MDFFRFIRWHWRNYETWQKWWLFAFFMLGVGLGRDEPSRYYFWSVAICIFLFYTGKWWIWDATKNSWQKYQKEKQDLFETIKTSDQK
jgi:hypothetical protein